MAKSKFVRVAVEGATTDGREISRDWIVQMASSYDPKTYGARINMEHLRGFSPEPPFNAYGDVLSLKAEEVELTIDQKPVKKLALFAQLDANDQLVALNRKGQKLYTSIEVNPNFAGTGKAYLMGLAVTDSPASLGTEMLQFAAAATVNPLASRKQNPENLFSEAAETAIELEADAAPEAVRVFAQIGEKIIAAIGAAFTSAPPANDPKPDPAPTPAPVPANDLSGFSKAIADGFAEIGHAVEASTRASADQVAGLRAEFAALRAQVEGTENHGTPRPLATGGDGRVLADF